MLLAGIPVGLLLVGDTAGQVSAGVGIMSGSVLGCVARSGSAL